MIPALNTVVHNEAHRILGLLEHASSFCDELVVVDQDSTDGTGDLAKDYGATVVHDECRLLSELSYQLVADNTKSDWILLLDADESIYPDRVIDLIALDESWDGVAMIRATYVDGVRWPTGPDRQIRYFRKGAVSYATGLHHKNEMKPARALYRTVEPWIRHWKTSAEQAVDDVRYDRLKAV